MADIDLYAQIGDLKEIDYRKTLAIATLIELLIDKGLLNRAEFAQAAQKLDDMSLEDLRQHRSRF